ncbi:MAG: response regulator [Flavobacterium sp.]|nr:response regulator [Flavobacterium sp.]
MTTPLEYSYKNVMIIDDNDIDRYIAKRIISAHNFSAHILSYENGIEAFQYLKTNQENAAALPEIIFVDIYMPEMSGFEFIALYDGLSVALKKHCAVYIISSTIDPEDLKRANNDPNVIGFHVKPIDGNFLSAISRKMS